MKRAEVCVLAAVLCLVQGSEQIVPFSCGTRGGGRQRCANHPGYTCTDCGYSPCLDIDYMCWSCYGADHRCYPYVCSSGLYCGVGPCDALEQNATVPRATEAQIMSAIAAQQNGAVAAAKVAQGAHQIAAEVTAPKEQTVDDLEENAAEIVHAITTKQNVAVETAKVTKKDLQIPTEVAAVKVGENQTVPFSCGTHGGGTRRCVNNPSYTCYDCGYTPCLDVYYMCWSCYGADHRCYPYVCSTGRHCGVGPCNGLEQNATVPRATETQIMSAIASKQKGAMAVAKVPKGASQMATEASAVLTV